MIEFTDNTIGVWFAVLPNNSGDWMAHLETLPDGKLQMKYRFRYYDKEDPDNDPFSGKDRKVWMKGVTDKTEEEAIDAIHLMMKMMTAERKWEVLKGERTAQEFMEEFMKLPFAHAKQVTQEEYERDYGNRTR